MTPVQESGRGGREMRNRRVEPREAVAMPAAGLWSREDFIAWVIDRSGVDRETAEQVADFDAEGGAR